MGQRSEVIDALDRIVYLLDRALAPSPKVRAFDRARTLVAGLDPDELASLVDDGRLTDLDGIGPSTAGAITQAWWGHTPDYLQRLEADGGIDPGPGAELLAALRGDCHTHSTWSDGGASIEAMARAARALGHEYLVMTDHSPRLTVAHGLSADRLRAQVDEIRALNDDLAPFRILTGIEVDVFEDGTLDQDEDLLAELDVVVASVHSKFRLPPEVMTRRLVLAVANPHVDILGHCTNRMVRGRGRPPSEFDAEVVFAACARFGTAVEVNCRPERQDPPDNLLSLAVEWDCRIAIDTDAHAPGQLEWLAYGCEKAARLGLEPERVVNTATADDLVAWAAGPTG